MRSSRLLRIDSPRGVTLIMVAGVLAVLAAMGAGFYTLVVSQNRSSQRYSDAVSAELMAQSGIVDAIARLREQTFRKNEDPTDPWYTVDWCNGAQKRISFPLRNPKSTSSNDRYLPYSRSLASRTGLDSDRFSLNITDAAGKINVNACDNLGVVLDNLCRVIGPPLVAADLLYIQPARWAEEGAEGYNTNKDDIPGQGACYYMPTTSDKLMIDKVQRSKTRPDGSALYGDGYAIARYRAANGLFRNIGDVRYALSVKDNPDHPELEELERNIKFNAIKDYITISSWVDTSTVCVGKFEWVQSDSQSSIAFDRDKSWVEDDPVNDPLNTRGSLRGCYVSIMNGHGAGQLRRIKTNGVDWIKIDKGFTVDPGPISSYMIVAKEDALTEKVDIPNGNGPIEIPRENVDGTLMDDPAIDYSVRPLCIHRAPININTASDKVLTALFMGINIQHGHPLSLGTDADLAKARASWYVFDDPYRQEQYLLTGAGIKRIPFSRGMPVLDRPKPWGAKTQFDYIGNFGGLGADNFVVNGGVCNEAHELAYRVIRLRQKGVDAEGNPVAGDDLDPDLKQLRGPFTSWDDFYFRVVRPWDQARVDPIINPGGAAKKLSLSPMIMANFNSNTDILKYNPNIEWIDRWGRNFTDLEPVMVYNGGGNSTTPSDNLSVNSKPIYAVENPIRTFAGLKFDLRDWNTNIQGTYIIRSYRYKSTDMIDKTDLNRSTIEFSFNSSGVFDITSIGQVIGNDNAVQAERRLEARVKVYDVWRETTQAQFVRGIISKAEGDVKSKDSVQLGCTGSIVRALTAPKTPNVNTRLALVTQPEPLVPKLYTITPKMMPGQTVLPTIKEQVDPGDVQRDCWGLPKQNGMPDIVANKVQPAAYDGQITLATNTAGFDPDLGGDGDTFLASFNGDLDTETCNGNGREQAKIPRIDDGPNKDQGYKFRVVDTCGLLGILNNDLIDLEPEKVRPKMYMFRSVSEALAGLKKTNYWNNVTLRQGDLRTEGVWLSSPGVSGNDATLKYMIGDLNAPGDTKHDQCNFDYTNNARGFLATMWFKSAWKVSDGRGHEFLNASNPGKYYNARSFELIKEGRWAFAAAGDGGRLTAIGKRGNDLLGTFQGIDVGDHGCDLSVWLHGGRNRVKQEGKTLAWENSNKSQRDPNIAGESPMFRVQPFRWNYVGMRLHQGQKMYAPGCAWLGHAVGHLTDLDDFPTRDYNVNGVVVPLNGGIWRDQVVNNGARPFMFSQLFPEGPKYRPNMYFTSYFLGRWDTDASLPKTAPGHLYRAWSGQSDVGSQYQWTGTMMDRSKRSLDFRYAAGVGGSTGQDVKWTWADPPRTSNDDPRYTQKVFSINNLNFGSGDKDLGIANDDAITGAADNNIEHNMWQYRHLPDTGTYAVIDELKISRKETVLINNDLSHDRATREMNASRYYLPPSPESQGSCPTFTSQTMLESIKGDHQQTVAGQLVTLARVTWTVFTPRFMHEYRVPDGRFKQTEYILGAAQSIPYRGPFWYETYNNLENGKSVRYDTSAYDAPADPHFPYRMNRISPKDYADKQPHSSKGVEVELLNDTIPQGGYVNKAGGYTAQTTFVDPDAVNTFYNPSKPNDLKLVPADKLRYRVRFRYPVDTKFVDPGAKETVDPVKMVLLDTPVFDDISVTYFTAPRILELKDVTE